MDLTLTHTRSELDAALEASRAADARVVMVPTMGALHDGHESLIRRARELGDVVVVTIFVNPTQFAPGEDFEAYPRTIEADLERCEAAGAGVVFVPQVHTVHKPGTEGITIDPGPLGQELEGASRPTHFRGVLTVVAKLCALVGPSLVVLGEKDYQQLVLVRQMMRAFNLEIDVIGAPTVRDDDGLARSSRNAYLNDGERLVALALSRALNAGAAAAAGGEDAVLAAAHEVLDAEPGLELDYLALRDPELGRAVPGRRARLLVAARVGATRLIDNLELTLAAPHHPRTAP